MYDATIGRWLSADPISFEGKDVNLYRYAENSPTIAADPTGPTSSHQPAVSTRSRKPEHRLCFDFYGSTSKSPTKVSLTANHRFLEFGGF